MNIIRCSGATPHFFDGDKYSECPMCGQKAAVNDESAAAYVQPEKSDGKKPSKSGKDGQKKEDKRQKPWKDWHKKDEAAKAENGKNEKTETVYASGTTGIGGGDIQKEPLTDFGSITPESSRDDISRKAAPDLFGNREYDPVSPNVQKREQSVSHKIMNSVSSNDSEKTVGLYINVQTEPVVGWLVCIKGESIGESYNLKIGKNSIGRGAGMDVMLANEATVSRDRHAVLTYEPKKRIFLLQPGDGNGMVYLNDELLLSHTELKSRDVIQLGEALFMFYPFCGEDFTWDDHIEK